VVLLALAGGNIQLVPDGTLLFHLVVIVVMVALLNATLLRPITRILDERERRTQGRAAEAQAILAAAGQKVREYEERMREARAAGYALLEQQRLTVSREREQQVAQVKAEVGSFLEAQKEKLATDVRELKGRLKNDARTQALEIGRQILGRQIAIERLPSNEQS
jgi:F-type H+-transporting ATPase subunit b